MSAHCRKLCRTSFIFLLLIVSTAALTRAADSVLEVVPSTALAWGVVNHMDAAAEKVQNLAKVVGAPVPSILDMTKKEAGLEKGVDDKGAVGFFTVPGKSDEDPGDLAFFIAVADEKEFRGNFDVEKEGDTISEVKVKSNKSTFLLTFKHGYAILAQRPKRAAVEAAITAKQSVAAEVTGYESWLTENDASAVVTAAGIQYAAKQVQKALKGGNRVSDSPIEIAAFMKAFQGYFDKGVEAAPKEISLALAGIRCDKQSAIRVIAKAKLVSGGEIAKSITKMPPVNEHLLSTVPGGPFVIAMSGVGIPNLLESYMKLSASMMKSMQAVYGMSGDDIEKMTKESLEAFRQVQSMAFVWKLGKRSDPLYSNMYGTMQVEDSQRLLEAQKKYAKNADKLMQKSTHGVFKSMAVESLTIAGKPAVQQEMTFDFSSIPGAEASRAMLDQMLGEGGKMLIYNVAADEHNVVMGIGVPQERMPAALEVLKQPKRSLAEDADIAVTAAMLPAKSQWQAYVSFRGYSQIIIRMTTMALKNNPGAPDFSMPAFPKSPPLGLAVKADPAELHAEIAVPGELVSATGEYVKQMQAMFMGMQGNRPAAGAVKNEWERAGVGEWETWLAAELSTLEEAGLRRRVTSRSGPQGALITVEGRSLVNFGSNDYLSLAADPRLAAAAIAAMKSEGVGSGASPLITGHSALHERLEERLAEFEGSEAALLFPSGFAANLAAVAALAGPGDVVFSDAKNHASIWDGCRLSRADVRAYAHCDWRQLDGLLARSSGYRRRLIVTDSLFSMDGDLAPLAELAEIAQRHEAMLLIDEAHATGVFRALGRGAAEHLGVERGVTARVGTLSKALGCSGGFISGSRELIDYVINRGRSYIYSTAAPAAIAAAALAAIEIVVAEPHRRGELLDRAADLRQRLAALGWAVGPSAGQIIPIVVGQPQRAVELAARLRAGGLLVPAIRPPTVPEGEACLRVSLTWGHTPEHITALLEGLGATSIAE